MYILRPRFQILFLKFKYSVPYMFHMTLNTLVQTRVLNEFRLYATILNVWCLFDWRLHYYILYATYFLSRVGGFLSCVRHHSYICHIIWVHVLREPSVFCSVSLDLGSYNTVGKGLVDNYNTYNMCLSLKTEKQRRCSMAWSLLMIQNSTYIKKKLMQLLIEEPLTNFLTQLYL